MMQDDTQDAAATMRAAALNATAQQGPAALETAHGYRRADDGSVVINETDSIALHALIFERVLCRRDRAFQRADDLRKQLREAGVAVNDTELTYRILPRAPTTHDYQRVDDGTVQMSAVDQAQLDDLLFQRMTAKKKRDYDAADKVQALLRAAGVFVDDRARTYEIRPPRPPRQEPTTHDYRRDDDGAVVVNAPEQAQLDDLLFQRMMAKKKRDYDAADRVQQLLRDSGVYVDDRARTYEVRPPRTVKPEKVYSRSVEDDSNIALAPNDYEQLVQRLQARQRAVRHRDWSSARAIRDELDAVAARCGCRLVLDDDACTFRFSTKPAREPRKREDENAHDYKREDDGCERDDIQAIDALLAARIRAKRCRDFGRADELRDELRALGVFVDDRRRTFYCKAKPDPSAQPESPRIWDNLKPKNDRAGVGAGAGRYGAVPPPDAGPVAFVAASTPEAAMGDDFAAPPPAPPVPVPVPRDNGFPDF